MRFVLRTASLKKVWVELGPIFGGCWGCYPFITADSEVRIKRSFTFPTSPINNIFTHIWIWVLCLQVQSIDHLSAASYKQLHNFDSNAVSMLRFWYHRSSRAKKGWRRPVTQVEVERLPVGTRFPRSLRSFQALYGRRLAVCGLVRVGTSKGAHYRGITALHDCL